MHVGNCTDGPADYKLSTGGGSIVDPQGFIGIEDFKLAQGTQNLWNVTGSWEVTFRVAGNDIQPTLTLTNSDIAILVRFGKEFRPMKLTFAAQEPVQS